MKTLLILLSGLLLNGLWAQQTISDTIVHDNLDRSYILYVPASYTPGVAAPLVLNFHGYTSNDMQQMIYGDFRPIADTAGFLLVHPMGTLDTQGNTYWNSGWGGTVDDIGFTAALIDSISAQYSVNANRIYSTGMSNGGFMSYTLACELSDRIAAIASVTGTMNANQSVSCNPQHPMPVMEIHGTNDNVVPYNGIPNVMESIDNVLEYWVNFNSCDTTPIESVVPNTSITDNCTATHFRYSNGTNGVEVEHYRIVNGAHTWPGASLTIGITNQDINASKKIWEFFAQYDLNGKIAANLTEHSLEETIYIAPNPVQNQLEIHGLEKGSHVPIQITSVDGSFSRKEIWSGAPIEATNFSSGLYFISIEFDQQQVVLPFVKK